MNRLPEQPDPFDQRARALYLHAASAVPPQVRFKLRPRPNSDTSRRPVRGWTLGPGLAGAAAVLALAIGIGQWQGAPTQPADTAPTGVGQMAGVVGDDGGMLASNPEFFAWLGSDDVQMMAME